MKEGREEGGREGGEGTNEKEGQEREEGVRGRCRKEEQTRKWIERER